MPGLMRIGRGDEIPGAREAVETEPMLLLILVLEAVR